MLAVAIGAAASAATAMAAASAVATAVALCWLMAVGAVRGRWSMADAKMMEKSREIKRMVHQGG